MITVARLLLSLLLYFPISSSFTLYSSISSPFRRAVVSSVVMSAVGGTGGETPFTTEASSRPLSVALVGAGLFASNTHLPTMLKYPDDFQCRAVWSRSAESAKRLASQVSGCQSYSSDSGFDELLERDDIDAVILALPLDVQPEYIPKILAKGKHLLSEKPIAATLSAAKELLSTCKGRTTQWSVGENFRHEPAFQFAAQAVRSSIGKVVYVTATIRAPFTPDNQYLNTYWRKNPSWGDGGLFIDAFPHGAAALDLIVGRVAAVSAQTSSEAAYLPGVDTMSGTLEFENGAKGVISVSYASSERRFKIEVRGIDGTTTVERIDDGYRVTVNGHHEFFKSSGIDSECKAFLAACRQNDNDINTPEMAYQDLALVEASLVSGRMGGAKVFVDNVI